MKSNTEQGKEFRNAYQTQNSRSPEVRMLQKSLIVEEFKEFIEVEPQLYRNNPDLHADVLKELGDLVYVCFQYAINMGWDLDEALRLIHQSNMSKLDEDGKPIYREDGKVLKGENYKPPNLTHLV